jgi:hypothetical protein
VRADLNGSAYSDLDESLVDALDNSTIRTAVIRNYSDETFLYSVFLRLNTGSVPLSPQELRQALHPGPFVKFVDDYSVQSVVLHDAMHIKGADVRMRDAELVIRYYAFRNFIESYAGNLKGILDITAEKFNRDWVLVEEMIEQQKEDFEYAIQAALSIFGENAFRKWNGSDYERSLNRAVLDVLIYYFTDRRVAKKAVARKANVEAAFKKTFLNTKFRVAIESTTKTIDALHTRLSLWGKALSTAISVELPIPLLQDNRIVVP